MVIMSCSSLEFSPSGLGEDSSMVGRTSHIVGGGGRGGSEGLCVCEGV